MTKVTAQMSLSLDGFYAGPPFLGNSKDVGGWMTSPEALGFFRVTRWVTDAIAWRERQGFAGGEESVNSAIVEESFESAGAYLMGRRMFDGGEIPWGDEPPFRAPVFVVTHRSHEAVERAGGTSFTFVTDGVEQAVKLAKEAAGVKDVAVAGGGTMLRHAMERGLVDELEVHIVPVVLGDGQRLFDASLNLADDEGIELTPLRVVGSPEVTHVRYAVAGRRALVLDDRGRGDE